MDLSYRCIYACYMGNFKITSKLPTTATTTKAGSSSQLSIILVIITLTQFMVIVDFTIVQVALPSIGREFGVASEFGNSAKIIVPRS